MSHIIHLVHPVADHSLTILRDRDTDIATYRRHAQRIARMLILEATRELPRAERNIDTPLESHIGEVAGKDVVFVPVLRAGLAMLFAAQELFPSAAVGFVGLERDEITAEAREYYCKLPVALERARVCVLDPMLATGGSMDDTVSAVKQHGATDVFAVCVVAAPEGIARMTERHPDVTLVTAAVDRGLDDNKFIRPGLGDFGDRYFGT